jgi:hypothetical protein
LRMMVVGIAECSGADLHHRDRRNVK